MSKKRPNSHPQFQLLKEFYSKEIGKQRNIIVGLKPSRNQVFEALFLCLDLGEVAPFRAGFPSYYHNSLKAVKDLLITFETELDEQNCCEYSLEFFKHILRLLRLQIDLNHLCQFKDIVSHGGLKMKPSGNSEGYIIKLPEGQNKETSPILLEWVKEEVRNKFKRKEANEKVSLEKHFLINDPKWKTNLGLATMYHSKGVTLKDTTPGTTSLEIEDGILDKIPSDNKEESDLAYLKLMIIMLEQFYQLSLRRSLVEVHEPYEAINVHNLRIEVEGTLFSLYEIFSAMSVLYALAEWFEYLSQFPYQDSIRNIYSLTLDHLKRNNPQKADSELEDQTISAILLGFKELSQSKTFQTIRISSHDILVGKMKRIEELKDKTELELDKLLRLFSSFEFPLPFNPIYNFSEKKYFLPARSNTKLPLCKMMYDYFLTKKLFVTEGKVEGEAKRTGKNHTSREEDVTQRLSERLRILTPYTASRVRYKFPGWDGDIDTIAYSKEENTLLVIQVKLSNVIRITYRDKTKWVKGKIASEAVSQLDKDLSVLKTSEGRTIIGAALVDLGMPIPDDALIYPLIVTDNFYADHLEFRLKNSKRNVRCISIFELESILTNNKVAEKQDSLDDFIEKKSLKHLTELIEKGTFWKFAQELAKGYRIEATLTMANESDRITMKL